VKDFVVGDDYQNLQKENDDESSCGSVVIFRGNNNMASERRTFCGKALTMGKTHAMMMMEGVLGIKGKESRDTRSEL
jgi:hypothetical protein